eukprot:gene21671-28688_t
MPKQNAVAEVRTEAQVQIDAIVFENNQEAASHRKQQQLETKARVPKIVNEKMKHTSKRATHADHNGRSDYSLRSQAQQGKQGKQGKQGHQSAKASNSKSKIPTRGGGSPVTSELSVGISDSEISNLSDGHDFRSCARQKSI